MPFIIGFLARFFAVLFARLSAFVVSLVAAFAPGLATAVLRLTSNLGKIALVIAAIGLAVAVFSAAITLALEGISSMAPAEVLTVGRMFLPDNLDICMSVLILARLKSLAFFWIVRISEKFERS
ncbi:hypothetical protein D3C78_356620 [compost metagenome]